MLEQGLSFEEAWTMCERRAEARFVSCEWRKRPIVYPNVWHSALSLS